MQKSEEVKAKEERYNRVEREPDVWGRIIGVRRLRPSEERKLKGMTSDLSGAFDQIDDDSGKKTTVPAQWPMQLASMVCEVDGAPFTFPTSRKELDAVYDRLDQEGLAAAMKALGRLIGEEPEQLVAEAIKEEAKNS